MTHQRNPVDTGRPGDTFTDVLTAVAADPGIDLLAVYALLEPSAFDLVGAIRVAQPAPGAFPTVVGLGGPTAEVAEARAALAAIGVPAYDGVAGAVVGVRALATLVAQLGGLVDGIPELGEVEVNPLRATPGGGLVALDAVLEGGC